jgi:cell division protease FtsH
MERFPLHRAVLVVMGLFMLMMLFESFSGPAEMTGPTVTVPYSTFKAEARRGNLRRVLISENEITAELISSITIGKTQTEAAHIRSGMPPLDDPELLKLLEESGTEISASSEDDSSVFLSILINILPIGLLIGFFIWSSKRASARQQQMGPFDSFGKAKVKEFDESMPKTSFDDVAGMAAQKRELEEVVDFLKNPEKYERIGGRVPRGILLMGPPGTGKTLLARAVAGEAETPFLSISASEFIEMFVGVGASRVRDLFAKAREKAPSIIFIDEIDAVGRSRGAGLGGGHDEREQTLNQLLGEMDGFEGHERVIVIAATNRPDVLDSALMRPGRFDRQVMVDMPVMEDRVAILGVHTRKIPVADDVDLRIIARGTPGMSGADLENLCNEAALFAARGTGDEVNMKNFDDAKDKVLMGVERPNLSDDDEKKITAFHESGHTLVARLIKGMDPVHKVTILPRGFALGVTQMIPEKDRTSANKTYLMGKLAVFMAGRSAEQLVYNDTSTGAGNDLKQCTDLAEKMVCQWGMSDRVGPVTYNRGEEHVFLGKKIAQDKTWSEQMGWIIDQEVEAIVRGAEKHADQLLADNREILDRLAAALVEREELNSVEINLVIAGEELPAKEEEPAPKEEPKPTPSEEHGEEATEEPEGVEGKRATPEGDKEPGLGQ